MQYFLSYNYQQNSKSQDDRPTGLGIVVHILDAGQWNTHYSVAMLYCFCDLKDAWDCLNSGCVATYWSIEQLPRVICLAFLKGVTSNLTRSFFCITSGTDIQSDDDDIGIK